jgi:Lon protease-like protein
MPMFPLGTVVLPGLVIPLHIFEERYRALMSELSSGRIDPPEFGVVLIERGSEVGGGERRTNAGTVVQPVSLESLPDGRWLTLVRGTERIRVVEWLADDPYPRARVEEWPDDTAPAVPPARLEEAARVVRRSRALAIEMGVLTGDAVIDLPDDPALAAWHLCALGPLGPFDRQRLLEAPGPGARVELLIELTEAAGELLEYRLKGS